MKVWEALAEATDQSAKTEDELDDARDECEKFSQAALVALGGVLGKRGVVRVREGGLERGESEREFEEKFRAAGEVAGA